MSNTHPNEPGTAIEVMRQKAIATEHRKYLAIQYGLTEPQVDVVRSAICINATDPELEFFLATAKRLDLDPFARQIWFVKRRQKIGEDQYGNPTYADVGRPETGIDGYRTVAERSEEFEGQDPTVWIDDKGGEHLVWLGGDTPPAACRVTMYRKNRKPVVAVGLFREYCPVYRTKTGNRIPDMWLKRGAAQLEKCVEALAFRRAFPRDLSGIRIDTEMEHVDAGASIASYSAPALPEKGMSASELRLAEVNLDAPKQAEARPVSASSKPFDGQPTQTAVAAAVETVAREQAPTSDATLPDRVDDEEAVMALVDLKLNLVAAATTREELAPTGRFMSAAKKRQDLLGEIVRRDLEPAFQAKWRELPPTTKGRR